MSKVVAVIDGNSLMHRAFHAVPPTMNTPEGTPTNAVFGFLSMLLKFIDMSKPDVLVCAFDAGKPEFRMKALEKYKAQRPPMDPDLKAQFPLIEELLTTLHVPVVKLPGWEGDDVLGTLSARCEKLGYECLLVSGDKDVYQLTSALTRVVTTKKGMTDIGIYGPDEVFERYGVTPAQFPDYLGLMGDSSDNIPGVPGVGQKTATKLLQDYGSIEGLYEHVDEIKGKLREKIADNEDMAYLSREVATIIRDLDFELDLEKESFPAYSAEEAIAAMDRVKITSHLNHLLRFINASAPAPAEMDLCLGEVLEGAEASAALEKAIDEKQLLGVAVYQAQQASLFDSSVLLGVAFEDGTAGIFRDETVFEVLTQIAKSKCWVGCDIKRILKHVYPSDSSVVARVTDEEILTCKGQDVALQAYVLDSSLGKYDIESLIQHFCNGQIPESKTDEERVCLEALAAGKLFALLEKKLQDEGSLQVYQDIDLPLVGVLLLMERTGAAIEAARMQELSNATALSINDLKAQIYELAGEEFNIDSPLQLSNILFEKMGYKHGKKTQRGYSTDASVLKELAKEAPIAARVLEYRELAKIKSTYMDALPGLRAGDGRIHTSFNELVTTTGRLSSSDPNLQNIPVRTDFGRQIRECFVPLNPGEVFVSADYSQIELRLLAHLSGDENMIAAFKTGADFHASTAARVFGVPIEEVTPAQRSRSKAVNFGIVYGQQAFGLSQSLDIPYKEAEKIIDQYFEAFSGVRVYLDQVVKDATAAGFASTMFERKRHIPELKMTNNIKRGFGERTAMNHPMQGSAADIIKLAMCQVQRRLLAEGFKARLMVQVHDELDLSCPVDEHDALVTLLKDVMQNVVELRVPLVVDVQSGQNWAQAH